MVRPNNDTLYSTAWIDLSAEPLVLTVPDTEGRYYVMPFMDAWTNVFAMVGKRTTGTGPGDYLLVGSSLNVSLNLLRFHKILRPNESFHTFLLFPPISLISYY